MGKFTTIESQISDYFENSGDKFKSEREIVTALSAEVMSRKGSVTNKDLILGLLEKLETENDIVRLDIYRQALELVVQRTPDDLPS